VQAPSERSLTNALDNTLSILLLGERFWLEEAIREEFSALERIASRRLNYRVADSQQNVHLLQMEGRVGMRLLFWVLLTVTVSGCVEMPPTPADLYHAEMLATRTWVRGPLKEACFSLPGPESQRACAMRDKNVIAKIRGTPFSHQDHFRIELAKARATDELRRLWTRAEQETWLYGPRTYACRDAPLAIYAEDCLQHVREDLAALSRPDNDEDPPVVRAERAVAQIEASERARATDGQPELETVLVQRPAVEPALMALGVGGELFGTSTATTPPEYMPEAVPLMPLTSLIPSPPVSCTSRHVGQTVQTSCY
jgi:hypothetical protein